MLCCPDCPPKEYSSLHVCQFIYYQSVTAQWNVDLLFYNRHHITAYVNFVLTFVKNTSIDISLVRKCAPTVHELLSKDSTIVNSYPKLWHTFTERLTIPLYRCWSVVKSWEETRLWSKCNARLTKSHPRRHSRYRLKKELL